MDMPSRMASKWGGPPVLGSTLGTTPPSAKSGSRGTRADQGVRPTSLAGTRQVTRPPSDHAEIRKKTTASKAAGPMAIAVNTTSRAEARPAKIHGARISSAVAAARESAANWGSRARPWGSQISWENKRLELQQWI